MEETKHKTVPFKDTVEVNKIISEKVITKDGKKIGKVKSVHIHPKELTVEGIVVDSGMFHVDQYFDRGYIETLNLDGVVLKITPVSEFMGHRVFDPNGKKVGKVTGINKSKQTNTLISIKVKPEESENEIVITSDYIATLGDKTIMLKEAFETETPAAKT